MKQPFFSFPSSKSQKYKHSTGQVSYTCWGSLKFCWQVVLAKIWMLPCELCRWPQVRKGIDTYLLTYDKVYLWGSWVAQSVKRVTLAEVMIPRFMGSRPMSGSVLTAQSLEPASNSVCVCVCVCVCLSLCLSPTYTLSLSLSLSQKLINILGHLDGAVG